MEARTHAQIKRASQHSRADAARERRATAGLNYRKVPVVVQLLETTDPEGAALLLATSDAPNEEGRYFRLRFERGRWNCRCASFTALGGCAHVEHVQAVEYEIPE